MNIPNFNMTDEEIEELNRLYKAISLEGYDKYNFGQYDIELDEPPPHLSYCDHEWRRDVFFSKNVYETCKKCGCKKEEL